MLLLQTGGNNQGVVGVIPGGADIYEINALPYDGTGYASSTMSAMLTCEKHLDELKASVSKGTGVLRPILFTTPRHQCGTFTVACTLPTQSSPLPSQYF